ncbi:PHB depolymerase family esterase [soil metagenome]
MNLRSFEVLAALVMIAPLSCDGCRGESGPRPAAGAARAAGGATTKPESLATCDGRAEVARGYSVQTLAGSHGPRTYGLHVPPTFQPSVPLPVIVSFHGDGGSGAGMRSAGFEGAKESGAILVYPDGKNREWDLETLPAENEDYVFFDELVADVARKTCIDPKRIFLFGFSRGGFFANQLACHRGNLVRAVASNAGGGPYSNSRSDFDGRGIFSACTTPAPAALIIHGDADSTVPPIAGEKCVRHWRVQNACSTESAPRDPAPCLSFRGCAEGHPVVACTVPGMGHEIWSRAAATSWSFFRSL